ncbi:MAG TPA: hypothetical protein ENJ95_24120 [Bacteroidetes bacterium]|nr:hypothetical protein [Bacteroidota bacterium]
MMKLDAIQHIEPSKLTTDPALRQVITVLLNIIEEQASRITELEHKNEELASELKRLKTGQGNLPKAKPKVPDQSLRPKAGKSKKGTKNHKKGPKNKNIPIDRIVTLDLKDKSQLPADTKFSCWREVIAQNVVFKRDNVKYRVAVYYSPSSRRTWSAPLPEAYCGEFGAELQAFLQTLRHVCDVTEGSLHKLMESVGVKIASGTINNILLSNSEMMQQEQRQILRAGIAGSPYANVDGTKSFEKGKRLSTQIICAAYFSAYYTMPSKSRLDILNALQGRPEGGLCFVYNEATAGWLKYFKVSRKHRKLLEKLFCNMPPFPLDGFIEQLDRHAPGLVDSTAFERIAGSFALGHYHTQNDFPVVQLLMSDGGKEYGQVAQLARSLCWLHDERPYRLLNPRLATHRKILEGFLGQYWEFYRQLLDFKEHPPDQQKSQKTLLSEQFDKIFTQSTAYFDLNKLVQKTFAKKEQLLQVLHYPFLPLHNNAAELAVRRKVRKRDISLHTMSERGTRTQDAYMTVVHTAVKLGVSACDYIADRVSRRFNMTPLAKLVAQAYSPDPIPL